MRSNCFVIATAGHVDHGKSALVKALTGTEPDRLPEEKARQITIDLGFAHLELSNPLAFSTPNAQPPTLSVSVIDVPGHEDFVRNMIAGVGSIDLALLVVAADDGWMPQTEEHLQILTYLGVTRAVVALSKSDIGNAKKTGTDIREQLRDTQFAASPIVPVSVRTGVGLSDLQNILARELAQLQPQRDIGKPRLFVDRAFSLHGIGTVVTGTLTSGTFSRGDSVTVQPHSLTARIRSIQNHNREIDLAHPGTRTALNLPDLTAGSEIRRGDVVTTAGFEPAKTVNVFLQRSARLQRTALIKSGVSVYFHHGAKRVRAKIFLLEQPHLGPGQTALAQIRLDSPALAFLGDRFVIRDASEQHTIAGGIVLDPDALPTTKAGIRLANWFRNFQTLGTTWQANDIDRCLSLKLFAQSPRRVSTLLHKSLFSGDEILAALQRLHRANKILLSGDFVATIETWRDLRDRAVKIIDHAHQKNSERSGVYFNDLRTAFADEPPEIIDAVIADLCATEFERRGTAIARRSHRAKLPPLLEAAASAIIATLSQKSFDPPARKQIAPNPQSVQALAYLIEQGEVIEIGTDLVLSRAAFDRAKEILPEYIAKNGPATASELRQTLQTSRRVIVPLLERLDRDRITRRIGDRRVLADISSGTTPSRPT